MCKYPTHGFNQVVRDSGRAEIFPRPRFFRSTITGAYQDSARSSRLPCLNIVPAIPNRERALKVDIQFASGLLKHSGSRLSAVARPAIGLNGRIREMRTIVVRIQLRGPFGHHLPNELMSLSDKGFFDDASSHACLIRDNDHSKSGTIQQPDCVNAPWEQREPFEPIEIPDILEKCAITIEKYCGSHALSDGEAATALGSLSSREGEASRGKSC
jgi:hypothetical protein